MSKLVCKKCGMLDMIRRSYSVIYYGVAIVGEDFIEDDVKIDYSDVDFEAVEYFCENCDEVLDEEDIESSK